MARKILHQMDIFSSISTFAMIEEITSEWTGLSNKKRAKG